MEIGGVNPTGNFFLQATSLIPNAAGDQASRKKPKEGLEDPRSPESRELQQLKAIDRRVRAHEQAHLAAAGQYARGGASFEFQKGPDGKNYAVGGEVSIDVSAVSGDPEATIRKMQAVQQAALAPADPSSQDRSVAAQAAQTMSQARLEQTRSETEERNAEDEENPLSPPADSALTTGLAAIGQPDNDAEADPVSVADAGSSGDSLPTQQNDNVNRYTDVVRAAENTQQSILDLIA